MVKSSWMCQTTTNLPRVHHPQALQLIIIKRPPGAPDQVVDPALNLSSCGSNDAWSSSYGPIWPPNSDSNFLDLQQKWHRPFPKALPGVLLEIPHKVQQHCKKPNERKKSPYRVRTPFSFGIAVTHHVLPATTHKLACTDVGCRYLRRFMRPEVGMITVQRELSTPKVCLLDFGLSMYC